jgi:hypothetical protein
MDGRGRDLRSLREATAVAPSRFAYRSQSNSSVFFSFSFSLGRSVSLILAQLVHRAPKGLGASLTIALFAGTAVFGI